MNKKNRALRPGSRVGIQGTPSLVAYPRSARAPRAEPVVVSVVVAPEVPPAAPLRPLVEPERIMSEDVPVPVVPVALLPVVPLPIEPEPVEPEPIVPEPVVPEPIVPLPIVLPVVPEPVVLPVPVPVVLLPVDPVLDEPVAPAGLALVLEPCVGALSVVLVPALPLACANARPVAAARTAAARIDLRFMRTPARK